MSKPISESVNERSVYLSSAAVIIQPVTAINRGLPMNSPYQIFRSVVRIFLTLLVLLGGGLALPAMSTSADGPCILPSAPTSPTPNFWVRADGITELMNNDPVEVWQTDINIASQTNIDFAPLYKLDVQNGLPSVYFDGINDYLLLDNAILQNRASGTVLISSQLEDSATVRYLLGSPSYTGGDFGFRLPPVWVTHNNGNDGLGPGIALENSGSDSDWHSYVFTWNSTQLGLYLDGAFQGSNNSQGLVSSPGNNGNLIGKGWDFTTWKGYIGEVIIFDTDLTDVERRLWEEYLGDKWTRCNEEAPTGQELQIILDGPAEVTAGETINYALTVTNNGAISAANVVVTQTLPVSVTYHSASLTPDLTAPLVWQLGTLPAQSSRQILVTATVETTGPLGLVLSSTATVTSTMAETNTVNNTATFTSTVVPGPATRLELTAPAIADVLMPFTATVTVYDAYDNIATGYTGTVTLTGTGATNGLPATHQFIAGDQGAYTFTSLALKTAGGQTLLASDGTLSQTTPITVDGDVVVDHSTTWREDSVIMKSLVITGTGTILTLERVNELATSTVITAENIVIGNGSTISADGLGYMGNNFTGEGPGGGNGNWCQNSCSGGGGGYGGDGGSAGSSGGLAYGSVYTPTELGSAGGGGGSFWSPHESYGATYGGDGGGAIHLVVSDTLVVEGRLSADGNAGTYRAGGGSGGSILIESRVLSGTGIIRANGGDGGGTGGGGGAGGRIALYYETDQFSAEGTIQTRGGTGGEIGSPGTVYLHDRSVPYRRLWVDNGGNYTQGNNAVLLGAGAELWRFDELALNHQGNLELRDTDDTLEIP